ncbi:MAG: ABC transporter substrate-binding protein [Candidatus Atabeyarchaeum deiterrae]
MPMSLGQKRALAVGVLAIVIVGVGAGLWWMSIPRYPAYETPGAPAGVPFDRIIKIGILDPMTEIQGDGAWKGAWLAAYEINSAGGIDVNGTTYYLGIIREDTYEAEPALDITKGVTAAQKIIVEDKAQYIIGGFRTESVKAYLEVVMDKKLLFIHTGAATDYFCQVVIDQYSRYKYCFRTMPINSTSLGGQIISELAYLRAYLSAVKNVSIHKWAILREDLDWAIPLANALKAYLRYYGFDTAPVADIAYPITATSTDFAGYWSTIQSAGAQMVIPVISAQGGIYMMTQYNASTPGCVIVGIDVQSQLDTYWASSSGKCGYEIIMQAVDRTNKTSLTIPFWDAFKARFGHSPLYTAVGTYDAVKLLTDAINKTQSFTNDKLVTQLETVNKGSPMTGISGQLAFTRSHDVVAGYPYGYTLFCEWLSNGTKITISSNALIYPNNLKTGNIQPPPWALNPA